LKKLKKYIWILIGLYIVIDLFYSLMMRYRTDYIPKVKIIYTKAVIINERNYLPNDNVDFRYTYSYSFKVEGKTYKGDSHNMTVHVGDTIDVKYNKDNPNINKSLVYKVNP
jgi:hypothetical protein